MTITVDIIKRDAPCTCRTGQVPILPASLHIPLQLVASEALDIELRSVDLIDFAGRFAYVQYQPVNAPDPDAVICIAHQDRGFNRAVQRLQAARWRGVAFPRWDAWEKGVERAVWGLYAPLDRLDATTAERELALRWAWRVLRERRVIGLR